MSISYLKSLAPAILCILLACTGKREEGAMPSSLPDSLRVIETMPSDGGHFDLLLILADDKLENGSFNRLAVIRNGDVVFSDHSVDGFDVVSEHILKSAPNKLESSHVFYYKSGEKGYLLYQGAQYGCCPQTLNVVKFDRTGARKVFEDGVQVYKAGLAGNGDFLVYGKTAFAQPIKGSSIDTLVSAYAPMRIYNLSRDGELDSAGTKRYNEENYVFAGYDYLDSVIVVSSVTGRFKAYIRNPPKEQEGDIEEDMCIFNDDYQTLTTEWLRELNIDTYLWDGVRNRAVIVDGMDSIYAYRGGCEHYNIVVQRVFSSENRALTDSAHWINEVLKLASMFKFDFYVKEMQQGRMRRTATSDRTVWLEFDDDNLEDNFFHAGIEMTNKKGAVVVSIGEYYN